MASSTNIKIALILGLFSLTLLAAFPTLDLGVSGFFYRPQQGFFLADFPLFVLTHNMAYYGARLLGAVIFTLATTCYLQKRTIFDMDAKAWTFLLLALLIGPVLVANVGFKDHWGRARPREVIDFGGSNAFSPALLPQTSERKNGSFVSGDGAFGFFLPSFAYVLPCRRSRRTFWGLMLVGAFFGFTRIAMGAHFLSDVVFAAFFMLASSACVFGLMYGLRPLHQQWNSWLSYGEDAS